jgi:hypothetical protein
MPQILTIAEIKAQYPDQWVLVGNPQMREDNFVGPLIRKIIAGIVLFHSKDKRELGYKAADIAQTVEETACIYTGEIPKNRKFWL